MIRKLLLFILIFACFVLPVQAGEIRFIQVAEAMYSPGSADKLKDCIDDINTLKKIDFVIFTGDNIASAKKDYLRAFLKTVKHLNCPVYVVIGDKDVSKEKGLNKETYREEVFKILGITQSLKPNYVFKKKGTVFIVADGAKEFVTAGNGYYKQETVDWLDKQLTKYKNKKVVIFQHFPLVDGSSTAYNTYKAQIYRDMLKNHSNVKAIISGHFNLNAEYNIDGVYHIIAPSYNSSREYKIYDIPITGDFIFTQLRLVN